MKFGQRLKRFRVNQGIGLREMARRLGIDPGNYAKYESGKINPPCHQGTLDRLLAPLTLTDGAKKELYGLAIKENQAAFAERFYK